jgi:aminoglycoside 3-N-acetyltransferase
VIDRASIGADLTYLGLRAGDAVVVHSSLRSLGQVDGGSAAVVDALLDVLSPDGLLVGPTFTYGSIRFDPTATPGLTGLIAETIRSWPGAARSWHPTHSIAAVGKGAAELLAGHERVGGLSLDSPLDRLAMRGGYVLLLGVGHAANSTVHLGEAHAGMPYLGVPFRPDSPTSAIIVMDDGELTVMPTEIPGCSKAFGSIERPLRERAAVRDGLVGKALAQLMTGRDVIDATCALLSGEPTALLCTDPRCYRCTQSRQTLRDHGLIEGSTQ